MQIKTEKSASDSIIETAKITWKHYAKGFNRFYLVTGSLSVILLLFGILDFGSPTITLMDSQYHLHFHISLIVGIGLLFSVAYVFMIMVKSKKAYFQDANDLALKHKTINAVIYRLTDESFTQDTQLTNNTVNWELFRSKKLTGEFVILYLSGSPLDAFVIDCQPLDTEKKEQLHAFLEEKMKK